VINGVNLGHYGLQAGDLFELKRLFEHATTFGSLIQVPEGLAKKLSGLKQLSEASSQDLFVADELKHLEPLVQQAEILAVQYDAVVANPPYMGPKGMNLPLKMFAKHHFADSKGDLFACFIDRSYALAKSVGHIAMVTMQSWMFLSSFQKMRERLLREKTVRTMAHLGARAFGSISGEIVQTTSFVLKNEPHGGYTPVFFRLLEGGESEKRTSLSARDMCFDTTPQLDFAKIPGSPLAYWVGGSVREVFSKSINLEEVAELKVGMATSDNERFLRHWQEVSVCKTKFDASSHAAAKQSQRKWFPYSKGGAARKWYGNNYLLVNWENDGQEVVELATELWGSPSKRIYNRQYFFRDAITWSLTSSSSGGFCARWRGRGFIFDVNGMSSFVKDDDDASRVLCAVNSCVGAHLLSLINPTMAFQAGDLARFPFIEEYRDSQLISISDSAIALSKADWNSSEEAWDFQSLPLLTVSSDPTSTLESSYSTWISQNRDSIAEMQRLEEENNRLFIDAYGLADELTPDVPIEQITLTVNPAYRYGGKMTEDELWTRFREDSMQELVSYAIGCMMGRYSLDEPGLIYAHSGNEGFDASRYPSFPADDDGIVPLTDKEWFADDAANRLVEFIGQAWDKTHLEANLRFLADNLSPKKGESSRDTLRRYLCDSFFKDHLQTYKKRPIYWLFSSGKQKAFQCLVYLHRYNASTLSRMRTLHVIPLSAKLNSYANKLEQDIDASTSTAEKKALEKQLATLHKQQAELATFDEKLRHHADQRITLDLDDGVKVNYGKFGDLLAEVKVVTGGASD
jgi:type II restriction/modification system DNA methylase subunit YeeA